MIMPHVYGEQARLELIQLVANNSLLNLDYFSVHVML